MNKKAEEKKLKRAVDEGWTPTPLLSYTGCHVF